MNLVALLPDALDIPDEAVLENLVNRPEIEGRPEASRESFRASCGLASQAASNRAQ